MCNYYKLTTSNIKDPLASFLRSFTFIIGTGLSIWNHCIQLFWHFNCFVTYSSSFTLLNWSGYWTDFNINFLEEIEIQFLFHLRRYKGFKYHFAWVIPYHFFDQRCLKFSKSGDYSNIKYALLIVTSRHILYISRHLYRLHVRNCDLIGYFFRVSIMNL